MNTIFKNPALIIVDVQKVLDDPKQDQLNNPRAACSAMASQSSKPLTCLFFSAAKNAKGREGKRTQTNLNCPEWYKLNK
jgi:hypothetical protein